jgi:hypothetical protein
MVRVGIVPGVAEAMAIDAARAAVIEVDALGGGEVDPPQAVSSAANSMRLSSFILFICLSLLL